MNLKNANGRKWDNTDMKDGDQMIFWKRWGIKGEQMEKLQLKKHKKGASRPRKYKEESYIVLALRGCPRSYKVKRCFLGYGMMLKVFMFCNWITKNKHFRLSCTKPEWTSFIYLFVW